MGTFRSGACPCTRAFLPWRPREPQDGRRDGREALSGGVSSAVPGREREPAGAIGCPGDVEMERTTAMGWQWEE
jgi:hypothetical protein